MQCICNRENKFFDVFAVLVKWFSLAKMSPELQTIDGFTEEALLNLVFCTLDR